MAQINQAQFEQKPSVFVAFTEQEIINLFKLLVEGFMLSSLPFELRYSSRFTALEDFIVETRRNSPCVTDFKNIDLENKIDENTIRMRTWLTRVAPSCVYRHRSGHFGQTGFYSCCFKNCPTFVSSQFTLIRHYRNKHYNLIPAGIFGPIILNKCYPCKLEFKGVHYLNQHLMTPDHIKRMCMLGKIHETLVKKFVFSYILFTFFKVSTLVADI